MKKTTLPLLRSAMVGTLLLTAAATATAATAVADNATHPEVKVLSARVTIPNATTAINLVAKAGLQVNSVTAGTNGLLQVGASDAKGQPVALNFAPATDSLVQIKGPNGAIRKLSTTDAEKYQQQALTALNAAQNEGGAATLTKATFDPSGTAAFIGTDADGTQITGTVGTDGSFTATP